MRDGLTRRYATLIRRHDTTMPAAHFLPDTNRQRPLNVMRCSSDRYGRRTYQLPMHQAIQCKRREVGGGGRGRGKGRGHSSRHCDSMVLVLSFGLVRSISITDTDCSHTSSMITCRRMRIIDDQSMPTTRRALSVWNKPKTTVDSPSTRTINAMNDNHKSLT